MKRTDWFTEARFGLFLHWGLYAIPGRGEWTYAMDKWEPGVYENLIHQFDPQDYDPAEWAHLAKAAGMKYVVFTTRHHDGFCLFDSHYTDYKITNTPYGKDVTRMLADAFRAEGLKVGFYHSLPDWTHPGYRDPESPEFYQTGQVPPLDPADHKAYQDLLYHHIEQLMTEYGKIDILFLDYTSQHKANEDYFDRERILEMVYRLQPDIIVNDRLSYFKDNVRDFDYYTPEICIPNQQQQVKGKEVPWETCTTMNNHWGYCPTDEAYKTLHTLTSGLIGCVSKNGNLLLNVGPEPSGKFPPIGTGATARPSSAADAPIIQPPTAAYIRRKARLFTATCWSTRWATSSFRRSKERSKRSPCFAPARIAPWSTTGASNCCGRTSSASAQPERWPATSSRSN